MRRLVARHMRALGGKVVIYDTLDYDAIRKETDENIVRLILKLTNNIKEMVKEENFVFTENNVGVSESQ